MMQQARFALMTLALVVLMTVSWGCAPKQQPLSTLIDEDTTYEQALDSNFLDEGNLWFAFSGEPRHHLGLAREYFDKKEMEASAAEIRKTAAFVTLSSYRATPAGKKVLSDAVKELAALEQDVLAGKVKSKETLDLTFARTHHALARHHQLKAEEAYAKNDANKAGLSLQASARHLESAAKWSGNQLSDASVEAVTGARFVAGKLVQGPGWLIKQTGRGVTGIASGAGKVIDVTGDVVKGTGKLAGKAIGKTGEGTGKVVGSASQEAGEGVATIGQGVGQGVEQVGQGADKIIDGTGNVVTWGPKQVGKGITALGDAINRFGKKIEK